jgi:hypothetical protein
MAVRARLRGSAEMLVAATLLWNALIILPIYVLGLLGRLYPWSVAVGSLVTSLVALVLAAKGVGWRPLFSQTGHAISGMVALPFRALTLAWRARSLVFLGVAFAFLLLPYLALSAYLGQAQPHWDPLWYHDTIVGFTIQNHGFAMVDLPPSLQKVNGYVRLSEMTQLWLVIFTDRRLADLVNILFAPAIAAGVYILARRYTSVLMAAGWGVAVMLMPACTNLLHSTYVDPHNAAVLLGGIFYATLARPRLRDAWLAALGLTLAIGSKGLSLVPVPVAGIIGAVILLRGHWHYRRRAAIATVVGGAALIVAMAATTYLRNYLAFHNPFWPDMRVDIDTLGIHWPGQGPWTSGSGQSGGGLSVNLNEPFLKLLDHLFALPWSVKGMFFDQAVDYGIGITWIAIPLGAIAFATCLATALRSRLERNGQTPATAFVPPLAPPLTPPTLVAIILGIIVAGSPALWAPRYHIAATGLLVTLIAWFTTRPGWRRLGEEAVAAVLVTSLMMFWWTPAPRWWFTPKQLVALAQSTPIVREISRELGAPTLLPVGLAREKELVAGSLLVFNERYSGFPSLFWNNRFSNRVMYMKGGPDFLTRAAAAGATWVFLNPQDDQLRLARAPGSAWQEVGVLNPINGGLAFRRLKVAPPAAAAAPPVPVKVPAAPPPPKAAPQPVVPSRSPRPVAPPRRALPPTSKPAPTPSPSPTPLRRGP